MTLAALNLCRETLDGVRNHSWRRPPPATPEGEVVAWSDRIAYVCHDFEDAVRAGILVPDDLPDEVRAVVGTRPSHQIETFVLAVLDAIDRTGHVGMTEPAASRAARPSATSTSSASTCGPPPAARLTGSCGSCAGLVERFADAPRLLARRARGAPPRRPARPRPPRSRCATSAA